MVSSRVRYSNFDSAHELISVSQRELRKRYLVAAPPCNRPPLPQRKPSSRNSLNTRLLSETPLTFHTLELIAYSRPAVNDRSLTPPAAAIRCRLPKNAAYSIERLCSTACHFVSVILS